MPPATGGLIEGHDSLRNQACKSVYLSIRYLHVSGQVDFVQQAKLAVPINSGCIPHQLFADDSSTTGADSFLQDVVSQALEDVWCVAKNPHTAER